MSKGNNIPYKMSDTTTRWKENIEEWLKKNNLNYSIIKNDISSASHLAPTDFVKITYTTKHKIFHLIEKVTNGLLLKIDGSTF